MSLTGAGLRNMKAVPNYRTVGAICEVVDNAIQYLINGRGHISVNFISGENNRVAHIIICDNGAGFQKDLEGREILDYCLWFGGGSNIGASSGLGKYGVGLPFSCCNQSSDYRIYSWREKNVIRAVGRSHAKFKDNEPVIEESSVEMLIGNVDATVRKVCKNLFDNSNSGTIVHWKNCDNLEYLKAATLIHHVSSSLERIYRNFLTDKIIIELNPWIEQGNFLTIDTKNRKILEPFDPLFTNSNSLTAGLYSGAPSNVYFHNFESPLVLEESGEIHEFVFRASLAKDDVQHPGGQKGGDTPLGRLYNKHNGISLLREERELAMGYFGFFEKSKSDPRVRWYKGELSFSAKSDRLLGVGADKSRAVSFLYTDDHHYDEEDQSSVLMHKLTILIGGVLKRIDKIVVDRGSQVARLKKGVKCHNCSNGVIINGQCNNEACSIKVDQCNKCGALMQGGIQCINCFTQIPSICPVHSEPYTPDGYCVLCGAPEELTIEEKNELFNILKVYEDFEELSESQYNSMLQWFLATGKKHFLLFLPNSMNPHELISYKEFGSSNVTFVIINKEHPFYRINVEPLIINESGSANTREALDSIVMLFLNWARTEKDMIDPDNTISLFRTRFGANLSAAMSNWNKN